MAAGMIFDGYNYIIGTDEKKFKISLNNTFEDLLNSEVLNYITIPEVIKYFGVHHAIKDILLKKVHLYDASSSVNSFIYAGNEYWLDKTQRNSIKNLINISGKKQFEIILGDEVFTFDSEYLKEFLDKLELYAYECKINTQKHLNNILKVSINEDNIEESINYLETYDFTTGYPNKLKL